MSISYVCMYIVDYTVVLRLVCFENNAYCKQPINYMYFTLSPHVYIIHYVTEFTFVNCSMIGVEANYFKPVWCCLVQCALNSISANKSFKVMALQAFIEKDFIMWPICKNQSLSLLENILTAITWQQHKCFNYKF